MTTPGEPQPLDLAQAVFGVDPWARSQVRPVAAECACWKREQWTAVKDLPIEQQGPESLRVLRDYLGERGVEIRPRPLAYLVRVLSELWTVGEIEWEPRELTEYVGVLIPESR